jgi:hypothetical protein
MSGIFGKADSAKNDRNAQNIVSTFNAARAAGNTTSYADAAAAITAVTTSPGLQGAGQFTGSNFYCPLSATEVGFADDNIVAVGSGTELTLGITP